jgi:hypothetical protein
MNLIGSFFIYPGCTDLIADFSTDIVTVIAGLSRFNPRASTVYVEIPPLSQSLNEWRFLMLLRERMTIIIRNWSDV